MKLKNKPLTLSGQSGTISLQRNADGIPVIKAQNAIDMAYGLGWVQMNDRQVQSHLMRLLFQGRMAEHLGNDPGLIAMDAFFRGMNFLPDPQEAEDRLEDWARTQLEAFCAGINGYLSTNGPVWEYRLLGYRPEPWTLRDCLLIVKSFGFVGMSDAQGGMEKLIVQMVHKGVDEAKIKEFFPYITEDLDLELLRRVELEAPTVPQGISWLAGAPAMNASNNWAVSGERSASGHPILCGDTHMEVNRLPCIWQEVILDLPGNRMMGVCIPGLPGIVAGRGNGVAWSPTYSFMDQLDYRIEECRDGKYRRADEWRSFSAREEVIKVKSGGFLTLTFYENEHGVLEGDPYGEGFKLVRCWSAARDCGAGELHALLSLATAESVEEIMTLIRLLEAPTFCWTAADAKGNIGMQMSGRAWRRPPGVSGLVPLPGWEEKYRLDRFLSPEELPAVYNPPEGYIVTTNQDLNHLGKTPVINLAMGAYRAGRITQLLEKKEDLTIDDMARIQLDLYSLQATRFMEVLGPLLPQSPNGRILKDWDCTYASGSLGASLFEAVYRELYLILLGDGGMGRDAVEYLLSETTMFNDYYANVDALLLNPESVWYRGRRQKEVFAQALEAGLAKEPPPYGSTRRVLMRHLLFGGKLPAFFGFDYGPVELPGSRATPLQGQIFRAAGRDTTFSPSVRLIADMVSGELHCAIPGGPSDRRFSRWYTSGLGPWLRGEYKKLA